ncbi:MAG TPA: histidine kinase [candidate division Zixibacteria bacterium]|nr:histidine kinase [candidate division Zixibacteria bacterium]
MSGDFSLLGFTPWQWALNVLVWSLWGGIIGAAGYFRYVRFEPEFPWWPNFLESTLGWLPWALALPLILWLGRRFRIDRERALRHTLVQLGLSVALGLALMYIYVAIGAAVYATLYDRSFADAWAGFGMPDFIYQRLLLAVAIYWVILGAGHAIDYYRLSHKRRVREIELQKQLAETQLLALRYQLQPHFLFNTLHSVASLVHQKKTDEAIEMLEGLSKLLRHTFEHIKGHESSLADELEFVTNYVKNERVRFADRLNIHIDVTEDASRCFVPNFVLQPLVENAIRHGIERLPGSGEIRVTAQVSGIDGAERELTLRVEDNGGGLRAGSNSSGSGVGLQATRERLQRLYSGAAGLTLSAGANSGAVATITIPYHTKPIVMSTERGEYEQD